MLIETRPRPPSNAVAEVPAVECVDGCVAATKGTVSDDTGRALRADLGIYAAWCGERRTGGAAQLARAQGRA